MICTGTKGILAPDAQTRGEKAPGPPLFFQEMSAAMKSFTLDEKLLRIFSKTSPKYPWNIHNHLVEL
jgi:hypothetical protein